PLLLLASTSPWWSPPDSYLTGWSPPDSYLPGWSPRVCRGGALLSAGVEPRTLIAQSPGLSQNLVPGLEISSLPDLFEISRLQIPKQTLQTKEESEKPLSSISNTYPGAPQPALLRILGDR
ncbi:unnamed protein product, partial [Staurois parvus]